MKKLSVFSIMFLGLLITGGVELIAAPPLQRDFLKNKPSEFKPCRTMESQTRQSFQAMGALRRAGQKGLLTATTKKVLVIPVQFPGGPVLSGSFRTDATAFYSSLRDFYYENSYALFTVTATIVSSVTLPNDVSYYNHETDGDLTRLFNDAAAKVPSPPGGYTSYDYLMIYHAGPGEEESGSSSDLWSLYYPSTLTAGGKSFSGFTVVPASVLSSDYNQLGVICHEFGHQLGLPDLYDTSQAGGVSTVGAWSLMDYPYGKDNSGNPPHLDAWSKNFLKYVELPSREITGTLMAEFGDIETAQTTGYYKIPIDVAGPSEYFVAEYRNPDAARMKYDLTAPATGIIIWHIDDAIALDPARLDSNDINSGVPHRGVALVPAVGVFNPPGHASDAFVTGSSFISPLSDTFSGHVTGIAISDFQLSNGRASASIKKIAVSQSMGIDKIINFPNPSGKGYPHPRSGNGVVTTIVFQATRPPQSLKVDIYSLAGERVASPGSERFLLNLSKSSDNSWIYEYDWNGKNESNEDVAQGIYIYRIKADGVIKTGKFAIVR